MNLLSNVGSQKIQRMVQFRAKPGTSLLCAIEEAVASEKIQSLRSEGELTGVPFPCK